jgi:hypothetical protein
MKKFHPRPPPAADELGKRDRYEIESYGEENQLHQEKYGTDYCSVHLFFLLI